MSSVNYSLKNKGVRLLSSDKALVFNQKTGRRNKLNPKYRFVGKLNSSMPNLIVSATDGKKLVYKGDTSDLNTVAKKQIVSHFYDDNGKRNKKTVAYFAIEKKVQKKGGDKK